MIPIGNIAIPDGVSTLAVIALDAVDYQLAREWNCKNILPKELRIKLGTMLRGDDDDSVMTFKPTDHDHVFPDGGAYCWPGEHPAETWHWLNLAD